MNIARSKFGMTNHRSWAATDRKGHCLITGLDVDDGVLQNHRHLITGERSTTMRATASDVARLASVSVSTVSRALSAPDMVSTPTLHKVQQAAERLGYLQPGRPRPGDRAYRQSRADHPGPEQPLLRRLDQGDPGAGAQPVGCTCFSPTAMRILGSSCRIVQTSPPRWTVCCSALPAPALLSFSTPPGHTPVVMLNRSIPGVASVVPDHHDAALQGLRHLWALGHSEIGYIGGPRNSWSNSARLEAFTQISAELDGVRGRELGSFQPYFSGGVSAADIVFASDVTAVRGL